MDRSLIYVLLILYSFIEFCLGDCYYDNYYYGYYNNDCSYIISAGAIVGIIIGAIVGVIIIVSLIVLCVVIGCNRTRGNRGMVIAPTATASTQAVVPTVTYYANQNPSVVSSYTSTYYPVPTFQPAPPSVAVNFHGNQYQTQTVPTAPPPSYSSQPVILM